MLTEEVSAVVMAQTSFAKKKYNLGRCDDYHDRGFMFLQKKL